MFEGDIILGLSKIIVYWFWFPQEQIDGLLKADHQPKSKPSQNPVKTLENSSYALFESQNKTRTKTTHITEGNQEQNWDQDKD